MTCLCADTKVFTVVTRAHGPDGKPYEVEVQADRVQPYQNDNSFRFYAGDILVAIFTGDQVIGVVNNNNWMIDA